MNESQVSFAIRGAIYQVYASLGPGLLESAYEAALTYQLQQDGLKVETQIPIKMRYGEIDIPLAYRLDMLVEDMVIVELKSVETIDKLHYKQLRTYLRLTNKHRGILVNFNTSDILLSIHTIIDDYEIQE